MVRASENGALPPGLGEIGALLPSLSLALAAPIPEMHWLSGDDLCDCTFQRIGEWTNPYIAQTLRVRMCCIWKELYKLFPQFVQEIPAYYDENRHTWVTEPRAWDSSEANMPLSIWYRQIAAQTGRPLAEVREEYSKRKNERPRAVPRRERRVEVVPLEELRAAREEKLRLTGWLMENESLADLERLTPGKSEEVAQWLLGKALNSPQP